MYYPLIHSPPRAPARPVAIPSPDDSKRVQPLRRLRRRGATAIEYLFMASLIIVVLVAAIQFLAGKTNALFQKADTSYPTEQQGP